MDKYFLIFKGYIILISIIYVWNEVYYWSGLAIWTWCMCLFQDVNWYKAKKSTGEEGMIPATYVQKRKEVSLHAMPYVLTPGFILIYTQKDEEVLFKWCWNSAGAV